MKSSVNVRGHTTAILVVNMRRFVEEGTDGENRKNFEKIRGRKKFVELLRKEWPELVKAKGRFQPFEDDISPEEIGYATGVFRSQIIEDYVSRSYRLDKDSIPYSSYLRENLQFKKLYWRAWNSWTISISPTAIGIFVIKLRREYKTATPLLKLGQDVIELQESLDIKGAQKELAKNAEKYKDDPERLKDKQRSVTEFLDWLRPETSQSNLLYAPVQWKMAIEVCKYFIEDIGYSINLDPEKIKLIAPPSALSSPTHDSYILYHIDEMWSSRKLLKESYLEEYRNLGIIQAELPHIHSLDQMDPVRPYQIMNSKGLQHRIASVIEGSLLKRRNPKTADDEEDKENEFDEQVKKYLPNLTSTLVEEIFDANTASWEDELCILRGKTGIVMPSTKSAEDELFISTLPQTNIRFTYRKYWNAIERMIELVIEIRVLSQLIERNSFRLLDELSDVMEEVRLGLSKGDVRIHEKMPALQKEAVNIGRLAALCRGLSNPQTWGRAEYSTVKAEYLLEQLNVPVTLNHIEKNIDSINSVVDHIDELYLADLAEQSNGIATLFSLGLGSVSLVLTLLILPSFWTDLNLAMLIPSQWKDGLFIVGTMAGVTLILAGLYFTARLIRVREQVAKALNKPINRLRKEDDL